MPKKPSSESLPELIARERMERVRAVLSKIVAEQQGLETLEESLKTGDNALVYDMGIIIIELLNSLAGKKGQKEKNLHNLRRIVYPFIEPEIDKLFMAIKEVGTKDYVPDKWKEAVIDRFDDSKKGFKAVKREDLEDDDLYKLRSDHEKKDFRIKLYQKLLLRLDLGRYGMKLILDSLRK